MSQTSPSPTLEGSKGVYLEILPLFLIFFLVIMDHLIMIPLGPTIALSIGLSPDRSGYMIAVYPLFSAISALVSAPFSDRWGRKKLLLILSAGFCLATLGCALSFNVYTMFFFRILSGLFGGPMMSNLMAYAGDLYTGEKRTKAMTTVMLAFALSSIIGVPFGAWVGENYSWESAFLIIAFVMIFCLGGLLKMRPVPTGIKPGTVLSQYIELFQLWTSKEIRKLFYIRIFMLIGLFGLMSNIGVWLTTNMGMNATEVGLCYMQGGIGAVFGNQLSGGLLRYFSKRAVISLGVVVMAIVVLLFTNLSFLEGCRHWAIQSFGYILLLCMLKLKSFPKFSSGFCHFFPCFLEFWIFFCDRFNFVFHDASCFCA